MTLTSSRTTVGCCIRWSWSRTSMRCCTLRTRLTPFAGHRRRKRLQDERSQGCARQAQRIHDVYTQVRTWTTKRSPCACRSCFLTGQRQTGLLRLAPSSSATSYTPMTETAILSARGKDAISSNIIPMILKIVREFHGRFLTI